MTFYGVAFLSFLFFVCFRVGIKNENNNHLVAAATEKRRKQNKATQIVQQIKMVKSVKADTDYVCT